MAFGVLVLAAALAGNPGNPFSLGVAAGEITPNGAFLWSHATPGQTDYAPVTYTSANGLYRTFRWGRNLELFFLDERSFRSAKASAGGACDNGGSPDLAPTAPLAVRAAFAALIPSLAKPPPAACVERIRDPSRTMLGESQFTRFTNAIARSNATFKVIVNEVPIQQFYALPYDRWEGYEAERKKLLLFLQSNTNNVIRRRMASACAVSPLTCTATLRCP